MRLRICEGWVYHCIVLVIERVHVAFHEAAFLHTAVHRINSSVMIQPSLLCRPHGTPAHGLLRLGRLSLLLR